MDNKDFIHDPNDKEIDIMLKYVPEYSADNAKNIKNKFAQKAKAKQKRIPFKKLVLVGAAASIIFVTTLVYAEVLDIGKIYRTIFGDNYEYVEQYIEPIVSVNEATPVQNNIDIVESETLVKEEAPLAIQSEYDGIVLKLISAINDENVLRIFATVTDTKGDRLGESFDFSSWGLSQGHGGSVSVVDYNNGTKTATLMITSLGSDHSGSATLVVNGFSSGREFITDLPENNINISELLKGHTPKIISQDEIWKCGGGGSNRELYENARILESDKMDIPFENLDNSSISNVGFVDGLLHIQTKVALSGVALVDGYYINVNFLNSEKEIIYSPTSRISFLTDKKYAYQSYSKEPHDGYDEMIYDGITSPEQLKDLSIAIDYMKSPNITEGNWEISFMVPEKVTTEFYIDRDILINGKQLRIDMISLSPLGITVHLPQNMSDDYSHSDSVYVEYVDGTIIDLDQSSIHTYESESTLIFGGQIIEIEKIQSLTINGEKIDISR